MASHFYISQSEGDRIKKFRVRSLMLRAAELSRGGSFPQHFDLNLNYKTDVKGLRLTKTMRANIAAIEELRLNRNFSRLVATQNDFSVTIGHGQSVARITIPYAAVTQAWYTQRDIRSESAMKARGAVILDLGKHRKQRPR